MKWLIAITTLGLALSFPSLSFAFAYMELYTKPIARSEVKNEVRGGSVEKDFMSLYTSLKAVNTTAPLITSDQKTDDEYILVFGVQIPRNLEL